MAKVGKSNSDRTISLRLQCVIKKHKISTMLRLPEDDADASKHLGVLTIYIVLTLRRLMSYIYIYIYIYMEHPFLMFLDHTQRRNTVGRTPLDE